MMMMVKINGQDDRLLLLIVFFNEYTLKIISFKSKSLNIIVSTTELIDGNASQRLSKKTFVTCDYCYICIRFHITLLCNVR